MPERRATDRPGAPERRTFPRPPLWLTLTLLVLGLAGVLFARQHRERVSSEFAEVIATQQRTPADVRKMKEELAELDLSRGQLEKELESRMKLMTGLKSEDFYLTIDTRNRKLRFYYGDSVLREADVTIGESRTIESGEKKWTFIPLKGAFAVEAKLVDHAWPIPEWLYVMKNEPVPAEPPVVRGGLGKYVIALPNGYTIHTPPPESSPLDGAKPGSYMVSEDVLRAIWPRIHKDKTQVYIY